MLSLGTLEVHGSVASTVEEALVSAVLGDLYNMLMVLKGKIFEIGISQIPTFFSILF